MGHLLDPKEPSGWHLNEPAPLFSKQKAESESEVADDTAHGEKGAPDNMAHPCQHRSPYPLGKFLLML